MNEISAEIKGHFLRLYAMAFTDSNFHSTELDMLYEFAKERGVNKEDLHSVLTSPIIESKIPEEPASRIDHLYDFACMAWADGKIVDDEINTLKKYAKLFQINKEERDEFIEKLIASADPKNKESKSEFIKSLNL